MKKGKTRTRRARKDILNSMEKHARARQRYDRTKYDKPASEES